MTLSKPGHNLSNGTSAEVPNHEAISDIVDGPEGYREDSSNGESGHDQTTTSEFDYVTGNSGSDEGSSSSPSSPSPEKEVERFPLIPSKFGSPFAYESYQSKPEFFKGLLAQNTRVLFDQVVSEASALRERLLARFNVTNEGSNGLICCMKRRETSSVDHGLSDGSDSGESRLIINEFDPRGVMKLPINQYVDSTNAEMEIVVHRTTNPKTEDYQHFVSNRGFSNLYINNIHVKPYVLAGPLPDFAVFKVAQSSFFWWHTAAALDYDPIGGLKRKRRSEDDDGGSFRKALKRSTNDTTAFPDSKTWVNEYRHRISICEGTDVDPPHQCAPDEMNNIDVILAIGAVWLGLEEAKADFAYANSDLFSFAHSMRMIGMHAVNGPNHFLIPLLFDEKLQALSPESEEDTAEPLKPVFSEFQRGEGEEHKQDGAVGEKMKPRNLRERKRPLPLRGDQGVKNKIHKGRIGHFMLAIAEKVNMDGADAVKDAVAKKALVRLRFMNSANGLVDQGLIRRVARNIVRNSGWLDDIWPRFDVSEEEWVNVLPQSGNRSAEHTVLNAWAYMLGIPLAPTRKGKLGATTYLEVRKMVNLALRGRLDSLTIQAWMQNYKYTVQVPFSQLQRHQTQHSELPNNLRNMQSVAINKDSFNKMVNQSYMREQAAKQTHAIVWADIPIPSGKAPAHSSNPANKDPPPHSGQDPAPTEDPIAVPSSASSSSISYFLGSPSSPVRHPSPVRGDYAPPRNWQAKLILGMTINRTLSNKIPRGTQDTRKTPTIIPSASNMTDDNVILGIAPIWEGLQRRRQAHVDFTYAWMDVLSPMPMLERIGAVGRRSKFIMPLFFDPAGKETNDGIGHLLLCVAEVVDYEKKKTEGPTEVQLEILDSRPGTVAIEHILSKAKEAIESSHWLARKGSGRREIVYRPPIERKVPLQVGRNTCGLHTILNAWAYMLNIPIYPHETRRRFPNDSSYNDDDRFIERGLQMVNLALAGYMDSRTIQAFFNVWGYSVQQDYTNSNDEANEVRAVGMNQDKFLRTLKRRQQSRRMGRAIYRLKRFPDADMDSLMAVGLNEEEAWNALVVNKGRVQKALQWHFGFEPSGVLPSVEDALSPKTPDGMRSRRP